MKKNWTQRYLIFTAIIIGLMIGYQLYSDQIYGYVCDYEDNIPGCFLAGRYSWEQGKKDQAMGFFKQACHEKYLRGCDMAMEFIENERDARKKEELGIYYCKKGFKKFCKDSKQDQ